MGGSGVRTTTIIVIRIVPYVIIELSSKRLLDVLPSHFAWLFLFGDFMIAITKVVNAYDNFLSTGKTYGTVMKDIALQLNGTPCPKVNIPKHVKENYPF